MTVRDESRVLTIDIKDWSDFQGKLENGIFFLQPEENIIEEQRLLIEELNVITSHYANHHACSLAKINPFDYLTAVQEHHTSVRKIPQDWIPWNYTKTLPESKD